MDGEQVRGVLSLSAMFTTIREQDEASTAARGSAHT
jgi:hypothetical protein